MDGGVGSRATTLMAHAWMDEDDKVMLRYFYDPSPRHGRPGEWDGDGTLRIELEVDLEEGTYHYERIYGEDQRHTDYFFAGGTWSLFQGGPSLRLVGRCFEDCTSYPGNMTPPASPFLIPQHQRAASLQELKWHDLVVVLKESVLP